MLTTGAVVAASISLTAGVTTSLVLIAGVMVTESAEVELAVATAVAVDVFLRFDPLLATKPGAALKVVQWPSLSQITAGELLWYRR